MVSMRNTKIKAILKILWNLLAVIGIVTFCILGYLLFDEKANCLDLGKIYDPEQKICRDDCLTWDETVGCVPITKENIRKKEKGLPFNK